MPTNSWSIPLEETFAGHGLRCTRQRRALYESLLATKSHPTAEDLHYDVSRRMKGISLATVYNTMDVLCRVGLAQKLYGADGRAHYDATVDAHPHVRCLRTGRIIDMPEDLCKRLLDQLPQSVLHELEMRLGCKILQVRIELLSDSNQE